MEEDPKSHRFENGILVTRFPLATNEQFFKDGEKVQETQWYQLVAWAKQAELANKIDEDWLGFLGFEYVEPEHWEENEIIFRDIYRFIDDMGWQDSMEVHIVTDASDQFGISQYEFYIDGKAIDYYRKKYVHDLQSAYYSYTGFEIAFLDEVKERYENWKLLEGKEKDEEEEDLPF